MRLIQSVQGPFWAHDASPVGNVLAGGQFWDQHILPEIDAAAASRPGTWAIDLGANQGWFTLCLAKRFGWVLAVEPNAQHLQVLQRNLGEHQVRTALVLGVAAYDRSGFLEPAGAAITGWDPPSNLDTQLYLPVSLYDLAASSTYVRSMALDDFFNTLPVDVGFIKADCQGADLKALAGLYQTIHRCRPVIVFEVEHGVISAFGHSWDDYLTFFRAIDYIEPRRIYDQAWDYVAMPKGKG